MDPSAFHRYTDRLVEGVSRLDGVVGLVALGSTAAVADHSDDRQPDDRQPDDWSDHDFFVVVAAGRAPALRADRSWLPDPDRIVIHFIETQHGVKAMYDDGHIIEFAVFEQQELHLALVNIYRVLVDRGGLDEAMAAARRGTQQRSGPDDHHLLGQFVTHLVVGAGRHARGERLSGAQFVKNYALGDLIRLLARYLAGAPATDAGRLDDLDPLRRVEQALPVLGARLDAAIERPTPEAALALLELADDVLAPLVDPWPAAALAAARSAVERAAGTVRPT